MISEITGARAVPFSVPLTERHGASGGRREGWLLRLECGRIEGWGEASPLLGFSAESIRETGPVLQAVGRGLVGRRIDWTAPLGSLGPEIGHLPPSIRFAVELAVLNLASRKTGIPVARILEPSAAAQCPVAALLAGPLATCLDRAGEVVLQGFVAVKLKVGSADPRDDARRARAVADRLGDGVSLRLDANRAWSMEQALRFAGGLADLPIEFIEEPLADPTELPAFAAKTGLPIALDESLVGVDPETVSPFGGLAALVLKPTLLGGIAASRRFAVRAAAMGTSTIVSATFETGVGLRGLAHLSASLPGSLLPAGLGTAAWLAGDTTMPPFPWNAPVIDLAAPFEVSVPGEGGP